MVLGEAIMWLDYSKKPGSMRAGSKESLRGIGVASTARKDSCV